MMTAVKTTFAHIKIRVQKQMHCRLDVFFFHHNYNIAISLITQDQIWICLVLETPQIQLTNLIRVHPKTRPNTLGHLKYQLRLNTLKESNIFILHQFMAQVISLSSFFLLPEVLENSSILFFFKLMIIVNIQSCHLLTL